ncbi:hepatocyte growth factor-regulated tyrosine kinase substrate [Diachasmimorpha longicaudata]|uniref:hepatocyte growth factor-regulated tyrosine kinase substrate n=1 Tax=Diachasmimorpha longicaudata TaxID=58733 RepID=UPI0030B8A959
MFRSASNFDKLLDKATSNLHLDPDWPTILQICDAIRAGDIQPKAALVQIKKKITNANPHVAYYGLLVLESCVKNCGALIHDEIGTKQYMEQLKELVKTTTHENVKQKTLELIQAWAFAFRNNPKYTAVKDTMSIMKAEGYGFPQLNESDAMFSADTAPEWADSDVCHRCRVVFGMVQRKHHCRACGQVFCAQCSTKTSTLPKFGIEKEVRVCDACYENVNRPSSANSKETDLPVEYLSSSLAQQQQVPVRKSAQELQEEEEFQLALALSQSEAEEKEKEKKRVTNLYKSNPAPVARAYSPPPSPGPSPSKLQDDEAIDSELVKYMNRKYWENRSSKMEDHPVIRTDVTSPSAPNIGSPMPQRLVVAKQQNGEVDTQMDEFVTHLRSQVEIFVNRMKSNSSRGRSISNDSFFQDLFMKITTMHSKLLKYIQEHDDTRVNYEGLQDKLAQVKDARAALDALREEHKDRLRREAEEIERMRQLQMAQKLDIMRKKKQEYLQYQRELALQKIQERERELQMRQEQQKQQYIMGNYQPVSNYMGPAQGSPIRHMHYPPSGAYPMSPTNQGVYTYGPPPMGNYPMQSIPGLPYGMPTMPPNHLPPHMMPNMPASQSDQPPGLPQQPGAAEGMLPPRENMGPPGMMPQMANVPPMTHIPGHQMGLPQSQAIPGVHVNHGAGQAQQMGQIPPLMGNQGPMRPPEQMGMNQGVTNMPQHPPGSQVPPGPQGIPQQMPIPSQTTQIPYQQPVGQIETSTTTETASKTEDNSAEPLISFD